MLSDDLTAHRFRRAARGSWWMQHGSSIGESIAGTAFGPTPPAQFATVAFSVQTADLIQIS